jgi:hypothetical protein
MKTTPEESGVGAIETKTNDYSALGRKLLIYIFEWSKIKQRDNFKTDFENMIE